MDWDLAAESDTVWPMKVIAVIPAYREATRIGRTLEGVRPEVHGIVVVDDGSDDGTAEAAQRACTDCFVLRHAMNRGQGAALRTGTEAALRLGADIVLHIDADGQHDPSSIQHMLQPLHESRADIVFGSRFLGIAPQGISIGRRALLSVARAFNALVMGIPRKVTDPQSGFRALSRRGVAAIPFTQDRMAHCSEILRLATRCGLTWVEVPVQMRYSKETVSKGQQSGDALTIVWHLLLGLFAR